jgi:Kef-type K+ transport system membrane component KefB
MTQPTAGIVGGRQRSCRIPEINGDLLLVLLLLVLVVVPRALQRYRIPGAVTALVMGFTAHQLGWVGGTPALRLFSTLGIVALFLFAGLEINGGELRRHKRVLAQHGAAWAVLLGLVAVGAHYALNLSGRGATVLALALLTPSTGFILSTLASSGLSPDEQFAVKTKAIALELLSLFALFVVTQSVSARQFVIALGAMIAVILVIPLAFKFFATVVLPYAPRSEFAFLLLVALLSAMVTRELGVYYLLGAFVTGVAAQRFRAQLPALSSEKMVDALEAFGSVFIPFYFFGAGMHIETAQASWWALGMGAALLMAFVPVRIAFTAAHRRLALAELWGPSRRVATALLPTLVFTLVLCELLRDRYFAPDFLVGALVVYAVVNTTLPSYLLGAATPTFESLEASPVRETAPRTSPP